MIPYYEAWTEYATCRTIGSEVFYPEMGESWTEALKVCRTACPVRLQCLDFAMRHELDRSAFHRHGVFGAMKPGERAKYEAEWLAEQQDSAA